MENETFIIRQSKPPEPPPIILKQISAYYLICECVSIDSKGETFQYGHSTVALKMHCSSVSLSYRPSQVQEHTSEIPAFLQQERKWHRRNCWKLVGQVARNTQWRTVSITVINTMTHLKQGERWGLVAFLPAWLVP